MVSRKERQKGGVLLLVLAVIVSVSCTNQKGKEGGVDVTRNGAALSLDYLGDSDVIGFLFEVFLCDEETLVLEEVVGFQDQLAPGGISLFDLFDMGSGHLMADLFVPLDPGCYDIAVTPVQSIEEIVASDDCSAASRRGVIVNEGEVTEIDPPLVSQCEGDSPGGLDVPVVLNHEPVIEISIPDKFGYECELLEVCARVEDPDNDPMEIVWASLVEENGEILLDGDGNPVLNPDVVSEISQPLTLIGEADGIHEYEECRTFAMDNPGTYHFIALVYDLLSDGTRIEDALMDLGTDADESHESLSFPLHVSLGGSLCDPCLPTTDRVCAEDGNAYFLDSCGEIGELAERCPRGCVDGECYCVIYTSLMGDNNNDGHSWESAKLDIQVAIDTAEAEGCEVWVRMGTYAPVPASGTIQLRPNVDVYGGFIGSETMRSERDFGLNQTVLSGQDVSHHVVTGADNVILDGFTISDANNMSVEAIEPTADNCGGGMLIDGVSPVVRNCVFTDNHAQRYGGAMCIWNGSPQIDNCRFYENTAGMASAGIFISGGATGIVDTVFEDMSIRHPPGPLTYRAPALGVYAGSLELLRCRFTNNSNSRDGGAVVIYTDGEVTVTDCMFENNSAYYRGGGMFVYDVASLVVSTCDFIDNGGIEGGGAIWFRGTDLYVIGSTFRGNVENNYGGAAIDVNHSNATIVNSVFDSNRSIHKGPAIANSGDLDAVNCTFVSNHSNATHGVSGAIWDDGTGSTTVANSIFYDNSASRNPDVTAYVTVSHSIVLPPYTCQTMCLADDPQFVDFANGDFTPQNAVCIDNADAGALPDDIADIDNDGIVFEPVPLDYLGNPRVMGGALDMGAIEVE